MSFPVINEHLEYLRKRYAELMHAVQTGVKLWMGIDPEGETSPKHLRVGVNSAMIDSGALVKLLIAKGVFTEDEFMEVLVEKAEEEKDSYEAKLREHYKKKITLA
jgi:hypothetical protein